MTLAPSNTPADDCGVSGGCGACPLFQANICGDTAPAAVYDPNAPDVDPAGPCPEGAGCCGGSCSA